MRSAISGKRAPSPSVVWAMAQRVSPGLTTTVASVGAVLVAVVGVSALVASAGSRRVQPGWSQSASRSRPPRRWACRPLCGIHLGPMLSRLSLSDKLGLRVGRREMLVGMNRGRRDQDNMVTIGESAEDIGTGAGAGAEVGALIGDAKEIIDGAVVIGLKAETTATGSVDIAEIAIGVGAETGGARGKAIGATKGDTETGAGSVIDHGRGSTDDEALGQARAERTRP